MVLASIVFSFALPEEGEERRCRDQGIPEHIVQYRLCLHGLETRLKDIFGKENRVPLKVFLTAQTFNIFVTLVIAYIIFGMIKPAL